MSFSSAPRFSPSGLKGANRSGPWNPLTDPTVIDWWDRDLIPNGAVASETDTKGGIVIAQGVAGKRPIGSGTALSGTYRGMTFDGVDDCLTGSLSTVNGLSVVCLVFAVADTSAGLAMVMETSPVVNTNNGAFAVIVNEGGAGRLGAACRGTVGYSDRYVAETLAVTRVVSVVYDFAVAGAGAVAAIRVNGVAGALTNLSVASAAGTALTLTLNVGGRNNAASLPWAGALGDRLILSSTASLDQAERFVGGRNGISW